MSEGWISLHRQLMDNWLWTSSEPFDRRSAWVDLLLLANHKEVKAMKGDKVVVFKPGTVNRSMESLAKRWRWSRSRVSRFLSALESDGMVSVLRSTNGTTITIVKYSDFQNQRTAHRATRERPIEQPIEQLADTNNNVSIMSNNVYNPPDGGTHMDEPEEEEKPEPMYVNDPEATQRKYEEAIKRLRGGRFDA